MADQNIASIGLDVSEIKKALSEALKAWSAFKSELGKGLAITIDDKSISKIGQAVAKEMKTIVAEVQKTAKTIETATKQAADSSAAAMQKGARAQTDALKKTSEQAQKTAKDLKDLAVITAQEEQAFFKTARAKEAALDRIEKLNARLSRAQSKGFAPGTEPIAPITLESVARKNAAGNADIDPKLFDAQRDRIRDAEVATREYQRSLKDLSRDIEKLERDEQGALVRRTVWFDRAAKKERDTQKRSLDRQRSDRESYVKWWFGAIQQIEAREAAAARTAERAAKRRRQEEEKAAKQRLDEALKVINVSSTIEQAEASVARARRRANDEAAKTAPLQRSVATALAQSVANAAKWILIYRGVHEAIRLIETGMRTVVHQGLEFAAQAETQKLGLAGILAENFKIQDSQGQQLTGMAALVELQAESQREWQQIQAASLAVVGTTDDLMMLYSSILPHAAKLGVSQEKALELTKATAVAASLMDISFNDARSAMVSLLDGRYLGRNRLVSVLGLSSKDITELKGTPELFDRITDRLSEFAKMGDQAGRTFSALRETLTDVIGRIGGSALQPAIDLFKQVMGQTGKSGILSYFENVGGEFQPTLQLKAVMGQLAAATRQALSPIREFFSELRKGGRDIQPFVGGATSIAQSFAQLLVWFTKASLGVATFISTHKEFLKWIAYVAPFLALLNVLSLLGARFIETNVKAGVLSSGLKALGVSVQGLAQGTVIAAVVTFFGILLSKLAEARTRAAETKAVLRSLGDEDIWGALAHTSTTGTLPQRNATISRLAPALDQIRSSTPNTIVDEFARVQADIRALNELSTKRPDDKSIIEKIVGDEQQLTEISNRLEESIAQIARLKQINDGIVRDAKADLAQKRAAAPFDLSGTLASVAIPETEGVLRQAEFRNHTIELELARLQKMQRAIAADSRVQLTPNKQSDQEVDKSFEWLSDDKINAFEQQLRKREAALKESRARDILTERQFNAELDNIARERFEVQLRWLTEDQARAEEYIRANNLSKTDPDRARQLRLQISAKFAKAYSDRSVGNRESNVRDIDAERAAGKLLVETYERLGQLKAQYFGTGNKGSERLLDVISDIERSIRDVNGLSIDQKAELRGIIEELRRMGPAIDGMEALVRTEKALVREGQAIDAQEALLNQRFENGRVAVGEYIKQLEDLRARRLANLQAQKENIEAQIAEGKANGKAAETIEELNGRLDGIMARLETATMQTVRLRDAFDAWAGAMSNVVAVSSVFDEFFDRSENSISSWVGSIEQAIEKGRAFADLGQGFKQFGAVMGQLKHAGSFSGIGGAFGSLFGRKRGVTQGALLGTDANDIPQYAVNGPGISGMQMFSGILAGAGVAIAIGGALFARATERAKESIKKSFNAISKQMDSGASTLGDSIAALERAREDAVRRYSKSKSGRKALKELLPDIDAQIEQAKKQAESIRKTYEEKLRDLRLGPQGDPFADFARTLFSLETEAKEYLNSFLRGTEEYAQALENVTEMFNIALTNAKAQLQEQMFGFEREAFSAMDNLFSLLDERQSLYEQQKNLAKEELAIEKESQEIQKNIAKIDDHRQDLAKKRLEIEKKIAEIIQDAADREMEIRRRGVLEAQLPLAQQKAYEIAKVRQEASDKLLDAEEQLAELKNDSSIQEEQDAIKDKQRSLDERRVALDTARQKLSLDIQINEVRLGGARNIAELEGGMFSLSHDRLTLERQRADFEFQAAQARVQQWQRTADLIKAIVDSGNGVIFNPPPNFPQIRVQIGNIMIDNSDHSTNNSNNSTTVSGGGGGGDKPHPKLPDRPGDPNYSDGGTSEGPPEFLVPYNPTLPSGYDAGEDIERRYPNYFDDKY